MAKALIRLPDPRTPGFFVLTELYNLNAVNVGEHGQLIVQQNPNEGAVYYAPHAWHSFTYDDNVRLIESQHE